MTIDATSEGSKSGGNSPLAVPHTCAAGAVLYVAISGLNAVGDVTSVTFNGVNLTKVASSATLSAFRTCEIWNLDTPTSGTHDISVQFNAINAFITFWSISFLGARPISLGTTGNNAIAAATSLSTTVNSTVANSYLITCDYQENSGAISLSGSESLIGTQANDPSGGYSGAATTILTTAINSYIPSQANGSSVQRRQVVVEVLPPPVNIGSMLRMFQ